MQLSIIATVLTAASFGAAQELQTGVGQYNPDCAYISGNYISRCAIGENLYCSGNINMCPPGISHSFDNITDTANELACGTQDAGDSCYQTVACCNTTITS